MSSPPSPAPHRPPGSRLLAAVAVCPAGCVAFVRAGRSSEGTACALRTSCASHLRSSSARPRRRRSTKDSPHTVCLLAFVLFTFDGTTQVQWGKMHLCFSPEQVWVSPPSERWRPGCQLPPWPTDHSLHCTSEKHTRFYAEWADMSWRTKQTCCCAQRADGGPRRSQCASKQRVRIMWAETSSNSPPHSWPITAYCGCDVRLCVVALRGVAYVLWTLKFLAGSAQTLDAFRVIFPHHTLELLLLQECLNITFVSKTKLCVSLLLREH